MWMWKEAFVHHSIRIYLNETHYYRNSISLLQTDDDGNGNGSDEMRGIITDAHSTIYVFNCIHFCAIASIDNITGWLILIDAGPRRI